MYFKFKKNATLHFYHWNVLLCYCCGGGCLHRFMHQNCAYTFIFLAQLLGCGWNITMCQIITRSQAVARIADRTAKIVGVTWPRPRPLSGKLFVRLLGIHNTKPPTKFEVCSSRSFGDMFDHMPKILGSRDLRHAHFQGKLCVRPLSIPDTKLHT